MDKINDYLTKNYNKLKDLNIIEIKQSLRENGFLIEGNLVNSQQDYFSSFFSKVSFIYLYKRT